MSSARLPSRDLALRDGNHLTVEISDSLPGAEIVRKGFADLAAGRTSEESLFVLIGEPRLRRLGFEVPNAGVSDPELQLYALLSAEGTDSAHSRYNSLIRLLVSFERAVESGAR